MARTDLARHALTATLVASFLGLAIASNMPPRAGEQIYDRITLCKDERSVEGAAAAGQPHDRQVRIDYSDPPFHACADVATFVSRFKSPAGTALVARVLAPDGSLVTESEIIIAGRGWTTVPITIDIGSVLAAHGAGAYRVEWRDTVLMAARTALIER